MVDAVDPNKEDETTINDMDLTAQDKDIPTELPKLEKDLESLQSLEDVNVNTNNNENDDDTQSNKSLDLNGAINTTESQLSEPEQEQPEVTEPAVDPEGPPSEDFPHTCSTCKKTFRHAATLSRHQKIHLQENQNEDEGRKERNQPAGSSQSLDTSALPVKAEQETGVAEKEENSGVVESGAEEEEKEGQKEERNEEEEGGSSELESSGGRPDKRKKICNVCSKRFWSLQDLTRHMRSHTGKNTSL